MNDFDVACMIHLAAVVALYCLHITCVVLVLSGWFEMTSFVFRVYLL